MDINSQQLSDLLSRIGDYYQYDVSDKNNKYRATSYHNAAKLVKNYTLFTDFANLTGIGSSILHDINEYKQTGIITRLQTMQQYNHKYDVLEQFASIYGVGKVTANKWYDAGYRNIQEIYHLLSDVQKGVYYYQQQITQAISYDEMNYIDQYIQRKFSVFGIYAVLTGSYRRKEITSSDIDILILHQDMSTITNILTNELKVIMAIGEGKLTGILQLDPTHNAHRIDIRIVEPSEWYYALMYFTGSATFNILMRQRAQQLGMKLNEYALVNLHNPAMKYIANSEGDIFHYLSVAYVDPVDRRRDLTKLIYI